MASDSLEKALRYWFDETGITDEELTLDCLREYRELSSDPNKAAKMLLEKLKDHDWRTHWGDAVRLLEAHHVGKKPFKDDACVALLSRQISGLHSWLLQWDRICNRTALLPFLILNKGPSLWECPEHKDITMKPIRFDDPVWIEKPPRMTLRCSCSVRQIDARKAAICG